MGQIHAGSRRAEGHTDSHAGCLEPSCPNVCLRRRALRRSRRGRGGLNERTPRSRLLSWGPHVGPAGVRPFFQLKRGRLGPWTGSQPRDLTARARLAAWPVPLCPHAPATVARLACGSLGLPFLLEPIPSKPSKISFYLSQRQGPWAGWTAGRTTGRSFLTAASLRAGESTEDGLANSKKSLPIQKCVQNCILIIVRSQSGGCL